MKILKEANKTIVYLNKDEEIKNLDFNNLFVYCSECKGDIGIKRCEHLATGQGTEHLYDLFGFLFFCFNCREIITVEVKTPNPFDNGRPLLSGEVCLPFNNDIIQTVYRFCHAGERLKEKNYIRNK